MNEIKTVGDDALIEVLCHSLYPAADRKDCALVLSYCRAMGLDPMLKPVHLVPMWDAKNRENRAVVMPGVGLYRILAARTGEYAGVTEPEFGPSIAETLCGVDVTYPAWCRVTVKRLLKNGEIAEFTAVEFWKENYATASRNSAAPNSMWSKRVFGQLAKCAEAQALRKAFPEVGSQPTSEEMEGKSLFDDVNGRVIDGEESKPKVAKGVRDVPQLTAYSDEKLEENLVAWEKLVLSGKKTPESIVSAVRSKHTLSAQQCERILNLGVKEIVESMGDLEAVEDGFDQREGEF